jgi:hypothetical protein
LAYKQIFYTLWKLTESRFFILLFFDHIVNMPRVIECLAWLAKIAEDRDFHTPISDYIAEAEEYGGERERWRERGGEGRRGEKKRERGAR